MKIQKIAVIGANGKAGSKITEEAVLRGMDVTAIVRSDNKTPAGRVLRKDLFDLTYDDLKGFDTVVDAFGTWAPETRHLHRESLAHLCRILDGSPVRLLIVGGAGSLYLDPPHTTRLMDSPDFPKEFSPLASAMAEALDELRNCRNVKWTYISPAADFRADGPRTGVYVLGGEELKTNAAGQSIISYADYAVAVVDEAEKGAHLRRQISVVSA